MYKINGITLDPQPTSAGWRPRKLLGRDGNGRPIYEPAKQFEMRWRVLYPEDYDFMQDAFLDIGATGTVVVDLPMYTTGSYTFTSYSGCYVNEPQSRRFFTEHYTDVILLFTNIITEK